MSEVLLPTWIIPEQETHEWLDEGSAVFGAAFAPGIAQRQSFGGLRLKMSRRHTVRGEEKAQLLSILQATRGRFNTLRTKVHFALRGAGLGSELLSNNTFADGTTGWSADSDYTLSVADRTLRATRNAMTAAHYALFPTAATTVVQYAPYVARFMVTAGRGAYASFSIDDGSSPSQSGATLSGFGLKTQAFVSQDTSMNPGINDLLASGLIAGDYIEIPYASFSRCALVDNGANALLRSDEFDNASWTKTRSSVSGNTGSTVAPDGTSTADAIIEDTSTNTHFVSQGVTVSASALDYAFTVALKAGSRTWAQISMVESTAGNEASAYINLSTGALGTVGSGGNWTNARAFVTDLGGGWSGVSLVARKTSAGTTVTPRIYLATGNTVSSYTGTSSELYAWRATLAQSSVPARLVQTTSAASTGTSQTGSALYLKGLPASSNGLLLPGDYFEINGEIKQATAALNSDAAGLGYLQFEPALVRSPADNDPVIVTDPMGKFLVSNIQVDNRFGTDAIVTYDLEHIYE